jgi:crotonobetainyl-CoA:carnitine CoA-transferase CaiB-like acyl-CoA transferase
MMPLRGMSVLALGGMARRPLARYLSSLGAKIVPGQIEDLNPDTSFLIDDLGLERLEDLGWTRQRIEAANPKLVHASVTTFGSGGPRSRWHGGEIIASAMGGTLRLTGDPDRAPVKEALDACTFHADVVAAAGMMAALYSRSGSGRGQHVDVSIQEVAFNRGVSGILAWQFDRRKLRREGGAINYGQATVKCIWRLADGWCFHSLMTGRFGAPANQALSDWMDECGVDNPLRGMDWLKDNRSTFAADKRKIFETAIAHFFSTRSKHDILTEGRRRGINASIVAKPADILADPHLAEREFWNIDGGTKSPSRFVRFVDGGERAKTKSAKSTDSSKRRGPLAGVRVLDFSWALVGSITTKTLGDLGADVIKVESKSRPCLSRLDVQVSASVAGNMDDKPWFCHLNTSKRSLALNLKSDEAMSVIQPLVEWADVVVENFSPGTMAKLGLDFKSLNSLKPGIILVSGSVYGQTGPLAAEWGVDGTGGALSGRTYLTGWPDRDPVIPGAVPYGDVIVPFVMAASAIAALQTQQTSAMGTHIDASMYEICVQQMRQAIADAQSGDAPQRTGNDHPTAYYQEVLPTSGTDRWIAVVAHDRVQLEKLCELAGGEDIAAWTKTSNDSDLMNLLQAEGIACGVVQDMQDLMEQDPQLAARQALVALENQYLGSFGHVRTPMTFSNESVEPYRAPGLGEHSIEVATSVAGLSTARATELKDKGVFE